MSFTILILRGAFGGLICGILNLIILVFTQGVQMDNLEQYGVLLLFLWAIFLGGFIGGIIGVTQISTGRNLAFLSRFYIGAGVISLVGLLTLGLVSEQGLLPFKSFAAKLGYFILSIISVRL
jgi:hypothetical protein